MSVDYGSPDYAPSTLTSENGNMNGEREGTPTPAAPRCGQDTVMGGNQGNDENCMGRGEATPPSRSQAGERAAYATCAQITRARLKRPASCPYLGSEMFRIYTEEGRGPDYKESSDDGGNDLFVGPPSPRTAAEIQARGPLHGTFEADAEIQRRRNKHLERYTAFTTVTKKSRLRYLDSVTRNKIWDREQAAVEKGLTELEERKTELERRLLAMKSARENYNTEFEVLVKRGEDEEVVHREFDDFMDLRSDELPSFERLRKWDV